MTILFVSFGRAWISRSFSFEPVYRNSLILLVSKLEINSPPVAIVEVRDHAVVADGADATGDIVEFLAHTPDVHIENYGRKGSVLFRVRNKRFHHPFGSFDLDEFFLHLGALSKRGTLR
jgi:hypothetical protein